MRVETSLNMHSPSELNYPRIRIPRWILAFTILLTGAGLALAQFGGGGRGGRGGGGGGRIRVPEGTRTAREINSRTTFDTPMWTNLPGFEKNVFTFARLRFGVEGWTGGVGGGSWSTDFPDADLNLSWRLQQLTSLKVDPNGRILRANDPELVHYPFLMTTAAGAMELERDEVVGLRRYLQNGGFLLITDFWGDLEWNWFAGVMKDVLPGRSFVELPLEHPIYHIVYEIRAKNRVPRINFGLGSLYNGSTPWERGPSGEEVHHRGIFDDKGRLIVLALHNSDDSDGWEREGDNSDYFIAFAEKYAYPLAINIIMYVLTH